MRYAVLCFRMLQQGSCKYGASCHYAHSQEELELFRRAQQQAQQQAQQLEQLRQREAVQLHYKEDGSLDLARVVLPDA